MLRLIFNIPWEHSDPQGHWFKQIAWSLLHESRQSSDPHISIQASWMFEQSCWQTLAKSSSLHSFIRDKKRFSKLNLDFCTTFDNSKYKSLIILSGNATSHYNTRKKFHFLFKKNQDLNWLLEQADDRIHRHHLWS